MSRWRRTKRNLDGLRSPRALQAIYLTDCPPGRGRTHARIVWLCLASHLKWGRMSGRLWINDQTIARETGLELRAVERGIAYLVKHRKLRRSYGVRGKQPGRRYGRILHMQFDGPAPLVELPPEGEINEMWTRIRKLSTRPAATFAVALAAHVLARSCFRKIGKSRQVDESVGELAKLLGMSRGGGFNDHLQTLRDVGILERPGERWRGFIIFGQLLTSMREQLMAMMPMMRRDVANGPVAEERMASMSEAFAALYPGSVLALAG